MGSLMDDHPGRGKGLSTEDFEINELLSELEE